MAWYTCTVNSAGPATDGTETSDPVVYINLTDTAPSSAFTAQWFYAGETGQTLMLAVAIAALNSGKHVEVGAYPPNPSGSPYTEITRFYLKSS